MGIDKTIERMSSYELWLPLTAKKINRDITSGRFLPGNTPSNKGHRWSDYMSKSAMSCASKGWENLKKKRKRPDNVARLKRGVIGIDNNGKWRMFPLVKFAALYVKGNKANVVRCCKCNDTQNANHKYKGVRFYYEDSSVWTNLIGENNE